MWCADAEQHKNTDILLLVLLHSLGNPWRKNAEMLLKKKFAAGLLNETSVTRVIKGHQVKFRLLSRILLSRTQRAFCFYLSDWRLVGAGRPEGALSKLPPVG